MDRWWFLKDNRTFLEHFSLQNMVLCVQEMNCRVGTNADPDCFVKKRKLHVHPATETYFVQLIMTKSQLDLLQLRTRF